MTQLSLIMLYDFEYTDNNLWFKHSIVLTALSYAPTAHLFDSSVQRLLMNEGPTSIEYHYMVALKRPTISTGIPQHVSVKKIHQSTYPATL